MDPDTMKPREPNVIVTIEVGALTGLAKELACDENVVASRLELKVNADGDCVAMIGLMSGGVIPVLYKDFAKRYGIDKAIRTVPHVCREHPKLQDVWELGFYIQGAIDFAGEIIWDHESVKNPNQMSIGDEEEPERDDSKDDDDPPNDPELNGDQSDPFPEGSLDDE